MARRRATPTLVDIQCEDPRGFRDFKRIAAGGSPEMFGRDDPANRAWRLPDVPSRMPARFHQLLQATGCIAVPVQPLKSNPRRPPKKWMRDCVRGASRSAKNPGAVCGALWYHKMSPASKRAALRREGKRLRENMRRVNTWEGAVEIDHSPNGALVFYMPPHSHGKGSAFSPSEARQLGAALTEEARAAQREKNTKVRRAVVRENPSAAPWVIGALALAGAAIWYLSKDKTAAASTTTTPGQLPPAVQCTVDQLRLTQWGVGAGVAAFYTPMIGIQDPVNAGTAFDILPSEISSQIDKLPSAASVVLVDKNNVFHYFANDSTPSVRRDDLFADYCTKFGKTTLSGFHPASTFML